MACVCIYVCMYVCMYPAQMVYVCLYVCMYAYIQRSVTVISGNLVLWGKCCIAMYSVCMYVCMVYVRIHAKKRDSHKRKPRSFNKVSATWHVCLVCMYVYMHTMYVFMHTCIGDRLLWACMLPPCFDAFCVCVNLGMYVCIFMCIRTCIHSYILTNNTFYATSGQP